MADLKRWEYGDPAMVAERNESKSCHGCKHLDNLWGKDICTHPKKTIGKAIRCASFERVKFKGSV